MSTIENPGAALASLGPGVGVDLFVYHHQANARITRAAVAKRLGLPSDRVVDCIAEQGNSAAATLPLALCHAAGVGKLRPGARVALAATGAGFLYDAGVVEWDGRRRREPPPTTYHPSINEGSDDDQDGLHA